MNYFLSLGLGGTPPPFSWLSFCLVRKFMILSWVAWICLLKLGLRPSFFLEFLDLSFEAGPLAQVFFKWVFLDGCLFNLKVKDLTASSWICLLKLGLRPSFFFNESSLMGFCLIWKLRILPRVLGFVFWSWAFSPAFF